MTCEYCLQSFGHDYRCPNYMPQKVSHHCSICGEGVQIGEEYITNDDGDYAHLECVSYGRDMAIFLGYVIKEMEDEWNDKHGQIF